MTAGKTAVLTAGSMAGSSDESLVDLLGMSRVVPTDRATVGRWASLKVDEMVD